jgi:hypothetical protein
MARRKKRLGKKKWSINYNTKKAKLSLSRGHKPTQLLELLHGQMQRNIAKLEGKIRAREAIGE